MLIPERGRALILAAAVLDRPNADPDDDLAVLARQLCRCAEENDRLRDAINRYLADNFSCNGGAEMMFREVIGERDRGS